MKSVQYHEFLLSVPFFLFLLSIDQFMAQKTRDGRCWFCGCPLHASSWQRKGFGIPVGCPEAHVRHSFCCVKCRKRNTPNSIRFLYGQWYSTPVKLIVSALRPKGDRRAQAELREMLGISMDTLCQWRKWWKETFVKSIFWRAMSGFLAGNIDNQNVPSSLVDIFEEKYGSIQSAIEALSKFLSRWREDIVCHRHEEMASRPPDYERRTKGFSADSSPFSVFYPTR